MRHFTNIQNKAVLPISIVIIAKNEAARLPRCLESVKGWVSEIIGVINDCTDNTREVFESYGAKVYEQPWTDHTRQKNIAIGYATQEWIFLLDADECVSDELRKSIFNFVNNPKDYEGAWTSRMTYFLGKWIRHGDWYPDYVLRFFRKGKGQFVGGNIHQKGVVEGKTIKLSGDILHYSFEDQKHISAKIHAYADAFLEENIKKGMKFSGSKVALKTLWRFFRSYFVKLGFLDGFPGFYIAVNQAFYTLVRYTRLYEYILEKKEKELKGE